MIGETTKFTFDSRVFEVIEEISDSNITMDWSWGNIICPHCKEKIEKIITHIFKSIILLVPKIMIENKSDKKELLKDLIIFGIDTANRRMLLNQETRDKVLKCSTFFKEVIQNVN